MRLVYKTSPRTLVALLAACLLALVPATTSQADLFDSLELYYNFNADSTDAGGILDQSGNTRNGSGIDEDGGGVGFSFSTDTPAAGFGDSLDLTTTTDYILSDTPGYNGVTGGNPRTVAAWVKLNDVGQSITLMEWGQNDNGLRWAFRINAPESNGTVGGLRVEVQGDFIIGSDSVNDNEWHHVAATFVDDGTPVVEDVLLYVDGVLQTTFTSGTGTPAIDTSGANQVTVGSSQFFNDDRSVPGWMDEVAIWSRVLTEQEIQSLASGTAIVPELGTLSGDYNADDVVDLADYTIWRNNLGTSNTLPNDDIGGVIGEDQYNQWRTNFGATASLSGSATAVVPEPGTLSLIGLALFTIAGLRQTRA